MANGATNGKLFTFDATHEGREAWEIPKVKGLSPGPLDEHTAQMREDGKMFVFGGFGELGDLRNDIFYFNTATNFWQHVELALDKQPCPRAGHSSVLIKHKMFVFGGKGADCRKLNDLWIFDT